MSTLPTYHRNYSPDDLFEEVPLPEPVKETKPNERKYIMLIPLIPVFVIVSFFSAIVLAFASLMRLVNLKKAGKGVAMVFAVPLYLVFCMPLICFLAASLELAKRNFPTLYQRMQPVQRFTDWLD